MFFKSSTFRHFRWIPLFLLACKSSFAFNPSLEQDPYLLSMGSAAAAVAGGTHAIQLNPAGIARAAAPLAQMGLGYDMDSKVFLFNTSILYPFQDGTVFALSQYSDFPAAPGSMTTYIGSVGLPLNSTKDFLLGLNLKYTALAAQIGPDLETGRGLGIDFGLTYDLRRPQGTIASFAAAIKDAGAQIRFSNNDEQPVTRTFILGAAYQEIQDTRIEMDLDLIDQTVQNSTLHNRLRLGAERFFGERFYSVRLGYDDLFNSDGYFTLGAGYHPDKPFEVSYAFRASTSGPSLSHFLSFIYRFDDLGKAPKAKDEVPETASSPEINIGTVTALTEPPIGKPVSGIPLRKMTIQADPTVFSPKGKQKTTSLSFPGAKPNDVSRWLIELRSSSKKTVRRIAGTGPLLPAVVWDGMGEDGRQVPDGKYQVLLKTFDRKGELLSDDNETVEVVSARSRFEIQSNVSYFSNRASRRGKGEIQFTIFPGGPSEVQSWEFEISEASSNKVVYSAQGHEKLPKTLKWNGKDLNKESAGDGNYLCLLIAQDRAGNALKTDALQIVLDSTPPELMMKGEDAMADFSSKKNYRFQLNSADSSGIQEWNLSLAGEDSRALKSFTGTGQPPREIPWDGSLAAGKTVEPGSLLKATFSATDRAGNLRTTDPQSLQVDFKPSQANEQMTLSLTTVYFDAQSSVLSEAGKKELEKAASSIRPYLNKSTLVIKAYAAPTETGDLIVLSHNRAVEVKKFLVKSLSLSPENVYAVGYSTKDPAKSTGGAVGDNHRRAVVTLTTKP